MRHSIYILFFAFAVSPAHAQISSPVNVVINESSDDPVGRSLIYELKEEVNTSSQMRLTDPEQVDSGIKVNIVTLDKNEESRYSGSSTTFSIAWSYFILTESGYMDMYLTQSVGYVGADRVANQARSLAASTNEKVEMAEEVIRNAANAISEIQEDESGQKYERGN
jgi:hypothetical protein